MNMQMNETRMRVTAGSDQSRVGQEVIVWSNGQQAYVADTAGCPIIDWTADVRFVETTSTVRKTPGWAVVLGVIGILFFLIGILFFFVKQDVPVKSQAMTIVNGSAWVTCVANH